MLRHPIAILGLGLLTACGDPLAQVPRLSDVDVEQAPVVEAVPAPIETDDKAGFLQRLMRKREVPADVVVESSDAGAAISAAPVPSDAAPEAGAAPADPEPEPAASPRKRGLFARLVDKDKVAAPELVELASLNQPDQTENDLAKAEAASRKGLFSQSKAARLTGVDAEDVVPGQVLPFGTIARACHVKRGGLGREVAKYPERGAKYKLYDSAPGNVALHTYYLTGFSDGCPRQFTAALAVFGSPGMHEVLRYGLPDKAKPWSETDKAYEKIKGRICGTGKRKPCGPKLSTLEKNTVFLSVYNRFEGADGWTNLLLHDGEVLALDQQG